MTDQLLPVDLLPVNPTIPPRPTDSDPGVRAAAAKELASQLMAWLQRKGETDATFEEVTEDADSLLDDIAAGADGYELAKDLEEYHFYSPDRGLVEILDTTSCLDDAEEEAVKAWVERWEITPPFPVGTTVKFRHSSKDCVGEITHIYHDRAMYSVYCAELGHERPGTPMKPGQHTRTTGISLDYTEVKA